jgi:hypothetical protein
VPEAARQRISSYGRGRFEGATGLPLLLLDGLVAGIWQRKSHSRQTDVRPEPFVELDKVQREELDGEIERLEGFLNSKVS